MPSARVLALAGVAFGCAGCSYSLHYAGTMQPPPRALPVLASAPPPVPWDLGRVVIECDVNPCVVEAFGAETTSTGSATTLGTRGLESRSSWEQSQSRALLCNDTPCFVDLPRGVAALHVSKRIAGQDDCRSRGAGISFARIHYCGIDVAVTVNTDVTLVRAVLTQARGTDAYEGAATKWTVPVGEPYFRLP